MEKKMTFNYFYGTEADQFSFYRIPKALFTDSYFKDLSSDAKILYGLMLDRMSLSIKNQWFDDKNRAYIYFSIEDIMELLNCGRNKAIKSMRELDDETGIGLIEKRRQGFGKVNVIYVKTFMPEKTDEKKFEEELKKFKKQTSLENEESTEVYNSNFMKSQNQTSRSPENKLQEVYNSNPNNTKVRLHIESCLTGSGTTDDNHILISGILWGFWSAVHGQTFCFCEDDIVFKNRIHEGFDIFSISPSCRSILHTLPELLCVFRTIVDNQF